MPDAACITASETAAIDVSPQKRSAAASAGGGLRDDAEHARNRFAVVAARTDSHRIGSAGGGTGTLAVAVETSNPTGVPWAAAESGFDVSLAPASSFTAVTFAFCTLNGATAVNWLEGAAWLRVSNQTFDAALGCVDVTLSSSSSLAGSADRHALRGRQRPGHHHERPAGGNGGPALFGHPERNRRVVALYLVSDLRELAAWLGLKPAGES